MFAKNRCRVGKFQSEMSEAVKAFLQKKHHRTDAPWGWSLFANGRLERRWRTSKLCWNVNSSNFAFYSSSFWIMCAFHHGIIVLDIFFINPNSRPLPTFLPFPTWYRRILAWGPTPPMPSRDARRRPCSAELLQGREAHLGANHPHTLQSMNNLAMLLEAGEAEWGCWGLWMEAGDLPGTLHIFGLMRPAFSSCFPVLLRCDQWFIYAIIYHCCRVFCLYMRFPHLLTKCAHPRQKKSHESIV